FVAPAQQGVIHKGILHINDDASGSVDPRHLLYGQNGLEELAPAASVLLGNLDAHQAEMKEVMDQFLVEYALFVHLLDQRTDFLVRELADVVAEKDLVFGERG